MAHSRDRSILGIISILSLISAPYLLFKLSFKLPALPFFYLKLVATTISSLNIAILFAHFAFGALGGIPVTILAIIIVLWSDLRMALFRYNVLILPFFGTAFIGYACSRIKEKIDRSYLLKLEKLDEELNILSYDIEKNKNYIKSL